VEGEEIVWQQPALESSGTVLSLSSRKIYCIEVLPVEFCETENQERKSLVVTKLDRAEFSENISLPSSIVTKVPK
jgi:hypothetical protein